MSASSSAMEDDSKAQTNVWMRDVSDSYWYATVTQCMASSFLARRLEAKHVSDEHEEILDEIARRAALDHDDMPENESDSSSDSHSSSFDDSDTDSDEIGTDNE